MGITKTDLFTETQNKIATLIKALAHPARIAIVEHLLKVENCICGDLVSELPLAQPTISQHLKELKNAEIITGSIEGNSICYCLNPSVFNELEKYIAGISNKLSEKNKCC